MGLPFRVGGEERGSRVFRERQFDGLALYARRASTIRPECRDDLSSDLLDNLSAGADDSDPRLPDRLTIGFGADGSSQIDCVRVGALGLLIGASHGGGETKDD